MGTRRQAVGGVAVGSTEPLFPAAVRSGNLLFLSGQAPLDPATMKVAAPDFAGQASFVMERISETLGALGASLADVVRVECVLANADDFPAWNETFARYFTPPRPARTTFVGAFVVPDMNLEVQVTACV